MISSIAISLFLVMIGAGLIRQQVETELEQELAVSEVSVDEEVVIPTTTTAPDPAPTDKDKATDEIDEEPDAAVSVDDGLIYPGASIRNNNGNVEMITSDDPQTVTDWYKERIEAMGLNTTSFVTTSANGNIENVLAAAAGADEVKIEITKPANVEVTTIRM